MGSLLERSPLGIYLGHLAEGRLAYQVSPDDGAPVFFPRVIAPGTGGADPEWRVSAGRGTVHATTVVHRRGEPPLNVALIDLDEGFRMMSRVEGIAPEAVRIGLRVRVEIRAGEGDMPHLPVFLPEDEGGAP